MANGRRIPYTPISVDYFQRGSLPSRTLYFLTHAHADHLYGLDSSFDQIIYCTSLTKQLLLLHIPSLDPDILEEIDYDDPRQIHIDCPGHVVITVTAIDAKHCPGSAMFLFQGYFGTILHTGDFRLTPELASHSLICNLQPDTLFLDNTYNKPIFDFPERSVSREAVTKIIMSLSDKRTFLAFNKIGKEDLLQEIALCTGYMIGVSEEQYRKMEVLGLSNICSLDCAQCQVIVVPFYAVTETNLIRWTNECPTQVIIPTCRYIGREHVIPKHPSVTVVHHSDHCSYKELYRFVELVKPVSIQPIVQRKDVCNISAFTPLLSKRPPLKYEVPSGVSQVLYTRGRFSKDSSLYSSARSPNISKIRMQKIPKGVQFISPEKNKHKQEIGSKEIEAREMECVEKLPINISPNCQNVSLDNTPTCDVTNEKADPELFSSTQTLVRKIQETCIQLSLDQLQYEAELTYVTPNQVKGNVLETLMVKDLKDQSITVTRSLARDQLAKM